MNSGFPMTCTPFVIFSSFPEGEWEKEEIVIKVHKITAIGEKQIGIVIARTDYLERLKRITSISQTFYFCPVHARIAYVYGCMTRAGFDREEYIFYWRRLHTSDWNKWFLLRCYSISEDSAKCM